MGRDQLFLRNRATCHLCGTYEVHIRSHYRKYHPELAFPILTHTQNVETQVRDVLAHQRRADATWSWDRESSRIYVILAGEPGRPVKIGVSANLPARMSEFQTGIPDHLQVLVSYPGSRADEQELHSRFASHWIAGEWFRSAPEILEWVSERLRETPEPAPVVKKATYHYLTTVDRKPAPV